MRWSKGLKIYSLCSHGGLLLFEFNRKKDLFLSLSSVLLSSILNKKADKPTIFHIFEYH